MKRIALLFAVAVLLATSLAAAPNPVTTVILVRHAEKASQEDNSPLTAAGTERSKELARVLTGVKVDAIYTTQFRRVQDTAAPVATAVGVTPVVRQTGPTYAAELAKRILTENRGQTVLVVGHTNSTMALLKALGASEAALLKALGTGDTTMPESQFDNLFVLTDAEGATPALVALRYGAAAR
jgi:broad specificity phosphatase PhoE